MVLFRKFRNEHRRKGCVKRDRKATEHALLMAAHMLFAEKGFENTRTLEIAKSAGVNEALITRYFGGKEGLLVALLKDPEWEEKIMPVECMAQSQLKSKAPNLGAALTGFFSESEKVMEQKESILRIATSRALLDETIAETMRKKIVDHRLPELEETLVRFTENSKLTRDELQAIAMLIGSANFTLNFFGRRVYKMNSKKVSQALAIFAEAIDQYVKSKE